MPAEEYLGDEPWRVDWPNACVWQGDAQVHLPPKALAVLRLLMAQAGQLVTKEALLEAVWPEAVVHEAALSVCMSELRKALRDSAQTPRFIQTVHRRGYRFIGSPPHGRPVPPPTIPSLSAPRRYARAAARRTGAGADPAAPVVRAGPAGRPTDRVSHRRARDGQNGRGQCLCGGGRERRRCVARAGAMYRALRWRAKPICRSWRRWDGCVGSRRRRAAAATAGTARPHLARRRCRRCHYDSARGGAASGPGRHAGAHAAGVRRSGRGADPDPPPRALILEDLHWSDYATLDLLTYLARRSGTARFLLLGTYRPVEVLLHNHPLQTVKQELVLHDQGVELPLELLTATEVTFYLARRFPGEASPPLACRDLAQVHLPAHGWPSALYGDSRGAPPPAWGAAGGGRTMGGTPRGGSGGTGGAGERAPDD